MATKITLQNQINQLKQQLENDRVAELSALMTIQDAADTGGMPAEAASRLTAAAEGARIELAVVQRRIAVREPKLAELEAAFNAAAGAGG